MIPSGYDYQNEGTTYTDGYKAGTDNGYGPDYDVVMMQDTTSHWPKQLFYHDDGSDKCTLVYRRWDSYYATSIAGSNTVIMNPAVNPEMKFEEIDSKFVTMVKNTDDFPNYDEYSGDTFVKRGFLPEEP